MSHKHVGGNLKDNTFRTLIRDCLAHTSHANLSTCRNVCNKIVLRWECTQVFSHGLHTLSQTERFSGNVINLQRTDEKSIFRSLLDCWRPGQGWLFGTLGERIHSWLCTVLENTVQAGEDARYATDTPHYLGLERVVTCVLLTSSLIRGKCEIPRTTNSMFWLASQYESYDDTFVQGGPCTISQKWCWVGVFGRCE